MFGQLDWQGVKMRLTGRLVMMMELVGKINTAHFSAATGREITILATSV